MKSKSLEDCLSAVVELTKGLPRDTYICTKDLNGKKIRGASKKVYSSKDVKVLFDVLYEEGCLKRVVVENGTCYQVLGYRPNFKGIERAGYSVRNVNISDENKASQVIKINSRGAKNSKDKTHISDLDLTTRASNALESVGILYVEDLEDMTDKEFLSVKSFGRTSLREVRKKMKLYRDQSFTHETS